MLGGKAASKPTLPHQGRKGKQEFQEESSPAPRQLSLMQRWNSWQAHGNSTETIKAGQEILCLSGQQEALLLLVQRSHALSFSTLGKITTSPCSSWAILLCLKLWADRVYSSLKSTENVSEHSNLSLLLIAAILLFNCAHLRIFQKCRIEPALKTVNCSLKYHSFLSGFFKICDLLPQL